MLLAGAPDGTQQLRSARTSFDAATASMASTFATSAASLNEAEYKAAHDAKRIALELQQRLAATKETDALPAGPRWELDARRLELTALQSDLRDARTQRLLAVEQHG